MSRLREHIGLAGILLAFFALGALYLWATPLLETPDEPSHFSVIKYIADEARLPSPRPAPPDAGPVPVILPGPPVYYAPPLYYALGALFIADLDTSGFAQGVIPNPNWERGWAPTLGRSPENKHIYVHTADQRPPFVGWAAAMLRVRIFSLLLGGVTVSGVYALARTQWRHPIPPGGRFGDGIWALATTALVAFNPAFLFVTIGVTNDALLIALTTWSFVAMARLLLAKHSNNWRWVLLLGVLLGLATLTKQSALAFLPVAVLAVVWSARTYPQSLKRLLLWGALVAALSGWWYLDNALAYNDPLGLRPHRPPTEDWSPSLAFLARQLGQALQGYWGVFGWGLILVEPIINVSIALFGLVGLLGFLFPGWLRKRTKHESQPSKLENRIAIILALGLLLNCIGLLLWLWRTSAPYGRLLFPTLGPLAVLLMMGWQRWLGQRRGRLFAGFVVLTLGLFAFVVPWRYLRPAYASPVVPIAASTGALALNVQFDAGVRLFGYRLVPSHANPGDEVELALYWQAVATLDDNLTVFVQLAPADPEKRVAALDDYLGNSRYPTSAWQEGEVIEQVHRLRVPDDVPAPLLYWFRVGLYSGTDDERLPVMVDGVPVPERAVRIGPLWLQKQDTQQPGTRIFYRLGSAIQLTGYDVEMSGGASVGVTLYWQAIAVPQGDWNVFVHLLNPDGSLITQSDGPPREGDYPTWAWQPGDRILDTHTLSLASDFSPGIYSLRLGLYQPEDGARMSVFDQEDQHAPDDVVLLPDIKLPTESE